MAIAAWDKAEALNHNFKPAFTVEDLNNMSTLPESSYPSIENIIITADGVQLLSTIKIRSAKGKQPNNIPKIVLKETGSETTIMLTHLFQQSLDSGDIPQDWRVTQFIKREEI